MTTRYHESTTGQSVAGWLADRYEALAAGRKDVTVTTYDHGGETPQDSIIVRIEGKTRPDEVLVLGSHIDSVNWSGGNGSRSPGADDNASGTATNLEIFRLLIGLVGSADIANDYRARNVNVVAMVQHDMNAWKAAGSADKIWLVTSNTDAGFNDLLGNLVGHYAGMPFEKASLSGGSSDHASWKRAGFATAFPFENPRSYNRAIHTANDNLETASAFTQVAGFAKLGIAYVMHFGGIP
jgi:leucyl aminopeptidase